MILNAFSLLVYIFCWYFFLCMCSYFFFLFDDFEAPSVNSISLSLWYIKFAYFVVFMFFFLVVFYFCSFFFSSRICVLVVAVLGKLLVALLLPCSTVSLYVGYILVIVVIVFLLLLLLLLRLLLPYNHVYYWSFPFKACNKLWRHLLDWTPYLFRHVSSTFCTKSTIYLLFYLQSYSCLHFSY